MIQYSRMKKIVTGLLLFSMLICLFGCGSARDSAETSDPTRSTRRRSESRRSRESTEAGETAEKTLEENDDVPTTKTAHKGQKTEELRDWLNGTVWTDFENLYYFDKGKVTIYTCVEGTMIDPAEERKYTKSGPEDYSLEYIEDYRLILNDRETSRVIYRKASSDEPSFKPGFILQLSSMTDSFWYTTEENSKIVWDIMQPRDDGLVEAIGELWPEKFQNTSGALIQFSEDLITIVDAP